MARPAPDDGLHPAVPGDIRPAARTACISRRRVTIGTRMRTGPNRGAQHGAQLGPEQGWPRRGLGTPRKPKAGIGFAQQRDACAVGLVGTQIKHAQRDRTPVHAQYGIPIGDQLFLFIRRVVALQEQEFGAVQTDAGGTQFMRAATSSRDSALACRAISTPSSVRAGVLRRSACARCSRASENSRSRSSSRSSGPGSMMACRIARRP